jgi:MmyB-like transcription regulator ligand binding domain
VIDERWNLMLANDALQRLMTGIAPELLEPPANTVRIALHPDGMAPYTINFAEWSAEVLHRAQLRATLTADPELEELYESSAHIRMLASSAHARPTPGPTSCFHCGYATATAS